MWELKRVLRRGKIFLTVFIFTFFPNKEHWAHFQAKERDRIGNLEVKENEDNSAMYNHKDLR